ncbi:MAG: hypothetical protein AAFX92_16230 [Pseudomonadota bacterium]
MNDDRSLERPVGPQELLWVELNRRGNGGVQLTSIAEFERPVDQKTLRGALAAVHARHPMLRARVDDRDRPWWCCDVPFERIGVRSQAMGPDFDLEGFYAGEATSLLDLGAESWRAVMLTDHAGQVAWLALTTNHGAVDGRSALVVLNDIDRFLADPEALGTESLPMVPPVEQALAAAGHAGDSSILPPWPDLARWPVERPASADRRSPHVLFRLIPASTVDALHRRLHAEGIHLAAGFCAAAVEAGRDLPGATDWFGIIAPTDTRADCRPPIPTDVVGEYVAGISLMLEPQGPTSSPLETARSLARQLHDNRPLALRMDAGVTPDETRRQVDAMAAPSDRFSSGLCVTDVGDLDRLSGRRVGFKRVLLMPSQNHGAHPVLVAIVTTREGACLSIGYDRPLRSDQAARAFADRYCEALIDLAG